MRMNDDNLVGDLVKGAIAGAVGTWVMGRVTSFMWEHEPEAVRRRYTEVTDGQFTTDRAATKIERGLGIETTEAGHKRLAQAAHWGLGLGAGMAYALVRRRVRAADWGQGLAFGTGFWALVDEAMTPVLGLAEAPQKYPWQAHARGLAGHLAYGVAADTTLDMLDRVA